MGCVRKRTRLACRGASSADDIKKVKFLRFDAQKYPLVIHHPRSTSGNKWRIAKTIREKLFPKNPCFSTGKRAFPFAALTKTLENSPVMFWKKSPTREKHRENGPFATSALFGRGEKSRRVGQR
jgi:hypothetical protein